MASLAGLSLSWNVDKMPSTKFDFPSINSVYLQTNIAVIRKMKKSLFLAVFFFPATSFLAGTIVIDGQYQDKNIYVQNSVSSSGVGFCAYEVRVNGQITNDEINSSAFEIDLA